MFYKRSSHSFDIWPGFVDALATVLMVIVFVLMTFVVAQLYLTEALNGKEEHVHELEKEIELLQRNVTDQKTLNQSLLTKSESLDDLVIDLNNQLSGYEESLSVPVDKDNLTQDLTKPKQIQEMKDKIAALLKAVRIFETAHQNTNHKMNQLMVRFNDTLQEHLEQFRGMSEQIKQGDQQQLVLRNKIDKLEASLNKQNELHALDQYRSEFFSRLLKILGNRTDMRVVGDRFVFQSEVLFDKASADLGGQGKKSLDALVNALKEIEKTIPKTVSWILRVDGHTDSLPIKNSQYPSNWELSSARAIAVVKYLVSRGISQERLVAAGFGEFQTVDKGADEMARSKNRRIEFKLDQK